MSRAVWVAKAAAAGLLATLCWLPAAQADRESCAGLRDSIYRLEKESVRPPGWYEFATAVREIYRRDCVDGPTRDLSKARPEFWYRADGSLTGVRADQDRPADGAFIATAEIGAYCARRPGMEPGMCAMLAGIGQFCAQPADAAELMNQCAQIEAQVPAASEPLRAQSITLDGKRYAVGKFCAKLLMELQVSNPATAAAGAWSRRLGVSCDPDFVAALSRRLGSTPNDNAFWPALGGLVLNGFGAPGAPQYTQATLRADPDFTRMCKEAASHRDQCFKSWQNMRSVGTDPLGDTGQAGAFRDCYRLYASVYGMCEAGPRQAQRLASLAPPTPPRPAPPAPPQPSTSRSTAPPQAAQPSPPQMSPQCQQLVSTYVGAARANDGARALAGYNALKSAGGCGVLDKVDRGMPAAAAPAPGDSRFVARGATPNTDAYVQPCNANQAGCAQAMRQLEQATSPQAQAAMVMQAISTGLELGAAMAGGLSAAMPQGQGGGQYAVPGNNTDMRSLAAPPIRNGVGQGSGARPQNNNQSTITGTTR